MDDTSCHAAARAYAGRGWRVFPCHSADVGGCTCGRADCSSSAKHPLTSHGCLNATLRVDWIDEWWREWPWANVAIATGDGQLVVLDVDPRHGGDESLAELEREHGRLATYRVRTGAGGLHLYFRVDSPLRSRAGVLPGLDIRGEGGYVVAPPSTHICGDRYLLEDDREPEPLPDWLRELAGGRSRAGGAIPEGRRHDHIVRLAGLLRRQGLEEPAILERLEKTNRERCRPPLPAEEIGRIARDAAGWPSGAERPPLTELGNSERFVARYEGRALWVDPWDRWLFRCTGRWLKDTTRRVRRLAKVIVRELQAEALELEGEEQKAALRWAKRSESRAAVDSMIDLARAFLPAAPEDFDRDPSLLNFANGTLELRRGELRDHRAEDFITKLIDIDYDPAAGAPLWQEFLAQVFEGDEELTGYVRRVCGYCATGETRERVLFVLHGEGANGKSTLVETIRHVLGEYTTSVPKSALIEARGGPSIPNDLAKLAGNRLAVLQETGEGRRLDTALVKSITGRDTLTARFLHAEFFDFAPTFKCWLVTNHLPRVPAHDQAIWDRLHLIPFQVRFEPEDQDPELPAKLKDEAPGILRWIVDGAREWYEGGLRPPPAVKSATEGYRRDEDVVGRFLEERCELDPAARTGARGLYREYSEWAKETGQRALSERRFSHDVSRRGFEKRRSGGGGRREWFGIALVETPAGDGR